MAIPFFSIDFTANEWKALAQSFMTGQLVSGNASRALHEFLCQRFPSYEIALLPSARFGFYWLLDHMFEPGDEIIVPAMGFPLYVLYLIHHQLVPVFVDVEPVHFTIDPEKIEKAITPKTKAILVTHLFGHPAHMDAIMQISRRYGIPVIEDCAHSFDSFLNGQETGTFGHAALFSSSVMKVPTTLGGGFLMTKDRSLIASIHEKLESPEHNTRIKKWLPFFVFNMISLLNSYPQLYSLVSHPVFGLIKSRNPALLRKILYSGMGVNAPVKIWERPKFSNYQASVGLIQFKRSRQMSEKRRKYAKMLNDCLQGIPHIHYQTERSGCYWNAQYYVIEVNTHPEKVFDRMFARQIHLMRENVWDCTTYDFVQKYYRECPLASTHNKGLIRIQNNSLMTESSIQDIGNTLNNILTRGV
ncbi:MAG: aminotransferase class I/II-fold pyridoxal phosphate-dependent enzyme [Candidatus Magnetomorum sp.]|nr:aminotransferase class I/II-fold pyridoxal phosphate-dependent enzyme [Candidatus Magnetomorum sp.]